MLQIASKNHPTTDYAQVGCTDYPEFARPGRAGKLDPKCCQCRAICVCTNNGTTTAHATMQDRWQTASQQRKAEPICLCAHSQTKTTPIFIYIYVYVCIPFGQHACIYGLATHGFGVFGGCYMYMRIFPFYVSSFCRVLKNRDSPWALF